MKNKIKKELIVSECFYSIQGEGQTIGMPSIFLRLAGCNLLCKSDSWICDSIEVWQKGVKTQFKDVLNKDYISKLNGGAHLIITGGEPLLHQIKIIEYIKWFIEEFGFKPIIEIETNGTIIPKQELIEIVNYWNCSPKLQNSGEPSKKRINDIAIKTINKQDNAIFKFVISNEEDFLEILSDYGDFIQMNKLVLMPSGDTQKLLEKTRLMVVNMAIKYNIRYSDRLHIVIWNKKTGV